MARGDELEIEEVEVGGVIRDDLGHEWAVPSDNVDDFTDFHYKSPLDFPVKDPRMHYQWIREDQMGTYGALGYVPVTRREVGFTIIRGVIPEESNQLTKEYGSGTTSYMQAAGMICMKIPKQYAEKSLKASEREAQMAMELLEPSRKTTKAARAEGHPADSTAKLVRDGRVVNTEEA